MGSDNTWLRAPSQSCPPSRLGVVSEGGQPTSNSIALGGCQLYPKHVHVAVAIAARPSCRAPADRAGFDAWHVEAFGIEGTGSYGVGLASFVRRHAVRVVEVNHCDRRKRRNHGKNDTIRRHGRSAVLAGIATAVPKTADGASEMVRQLKVARDTAVKARSSAIITLKTLIVNAPASSAKPSSRLLAS